MRKIRKLSQEEILKIAAGEVVERPANVVKELLENAVDAGASEISIYIEQAGKSLIRIIDDGCGMNKNDAYLCIEQYATSKISSVNDLNSIRSFGFRGEALSSIAAVSSMMLTTKEEESENAITLLIKEGKVIKETISSSNRGTDISVQNIFFNVPARKKFLKSKETEWRSILNLFQAFSLTYPEVGFKLFNDNKLFYTLSKAENIHKRALQLFDIRLSEHLLKINQMSDDCGIDGIITDPQYTRYDRTNIYLFVNKRWIKDYKLTQSVIKGYQSILPVDRFPFAVIFLSVSPESVDINIHPRKEEVQFLHPRLIQKTIQNVIKKRLEEHANTMLENIKKEEVHKLYLTNAKKEEINYASIVSEENKIKSSTPEDKIFFNKILDESFVKREYNQTGFNNKEIKSKNENLKITEEEVNLNFQQTCLENKETNFIKESQNYRVIGQIFLTYILAESENSILLIDQHAAHERIMYEQVKKQFNRQSRIQLFFPYTIELNIEEIEIIFPYLSLFESFGITIEHFSQKDLVIRQTPVYLKNQSLKDVIDKAVSLIKENNSIDSAELKLIVQEKIHAQLSCKAAIKAGDELSLDSMNELIKTLHKTENKLTCPHGRPTMWDISISEIEKKFKRDYRKKY